MTSYERNKVRIFMLQVRKRGSYQRWGVTGPSYFFRQKDAMTERKDAERMRPNLEYRVVSYVPEQFPYSC